MATLAVQNVSRLNGTAIPAYAAAAAGGDDFLPGRNTFLHVKNGSGAPITVTVVTPGTIGGHAIANVVVSVPATTGERIIGPFPAEYFADPADGLAKITYSGVTSLTIGAFRVIPQL